MIKVSRLLTARATYLYGWVLPNGDYLEAKVLHMRTACEYLNIDYLEEYEYKYDMMYNKGWIRLTYDGVSVDKMTREKLHRLQMALMTNMNQNRGTDDEYYIDQDTGHTVTTLADLLVANDVSDLTRAKAYA